MQSCARYKASKLLPTTRTFSISLSQEYLVKGKCDGRCFRGITIWELFTAPENRTLGLTHSAEESRKCLTMVQMSVCNTVTCSFSDSLLETKSRLMEGKTKMLSLRSVQLLQFLPKTKRISKATTMMSRCDTKGPTQVSPLSLFRLSST